jgi:hypothetical protein
MIESENGSISIEFAVVFPIILVFFLALVQLSLLWNARHLVSYASFVGTRAVSIYPSDLERVKKYVREALIPIMGIKELLFDPLEVEVMKDEKRVERLEPGDEFVLEIKFKYRLNVPVVNVLMGKREFSGYYRTIVERKKWFVEPCPGWEKGECS